MARPRIRTVKPEMWQDEKVGDLSHGARLLLVGLVTMADDEGRLRGRPQAILGHVFPWDDDVTPAKIKRWIGDIERQGIVLTYEFEGKPYIAFRHWRRHQKINKATPSTLPLPPDPDVERDNAVKLRDDSRTTPVAVRDDVGSSPVAVTSPRVGAHSDPIRSKGDSDLSQLVEEILAKLAECDRWTVDQIGTRVQVENAIASFPDADHMKAARDAVVWGLRGNYRNRNAGTAFLTALQKMAERGEREGAKPGRNRPSAVEWDQRAAELEARERNQESAA